MALRRVAWLLPPALLVGLGVLLLSSTGRDDSYITYWPAERLALSGEIVNYNGERVEQSSSLLQVVALAAAFRATGVGLPTLGPLASIAAGLLCLVLLGRAAVRLDLAWPLSPAVLTATAPPFVYWSFSGMEGTLAAAALMALVLTWSRLLAPGSRRGFPWAALGATAAFCAVRPEAPLVTLSILGGAAVAAVASRVAARRRGGTPAVDGRGLAVAAGLTVTAVLALSAYRLAYFSSLFPQPVVAKVGGIDGRSLALGLRYLLAHALSSPLCAGFFGLAAGAVVVSTWRSLTGRVVGLSGAVELLALLATGAYACFIVAAGGDWMELGRFLVPFVPCAALLVSLLVGRTVERRSRPLAAAVLAAVAALGALGIWRADNARSTGMTLASALAYHRGYAQDLGATEYSWFERTNLIHARDIPTLHYLKRVVGELGRAGVGELRVLSGQMGMLSYYLARLGGPSSPSPRLRFTDLRGIADRTFTDCPVTSKLTRGRGGLVHPPHWTFTHLEELERSCGFEKPDLVFELFPSRRIRSVLRGRGYALLYVQEGFRAGAAPVQAGEYIALRRPLAEAIGWRETVVLPIEALVSGRFKRPVGERSGPDEVRRQPRHLRRTGKSERPGNRGGGSGGFSAPGGGGS